MILNMKTIKQNYLLNGNSKEIYDFIINPRKFGKITGNKASNAGKEGGKFSAYDGYVFGENIKLFPGRKIVQKWTIEDLEGKFLDLTINLKEKNKKQTEVEMVVENVPDEFYEDLNALFIEIYWEPIKDYLHDLLFK